jgi:SPP1 family predicted phage head-tail adaptor
MTLRLSARDKDQRITLQTRATGTNALNEPSGAWVDSFTCWARCRPLRGRDFVAAAQQTQTVDVEFGIDYRSGVTGAMRVVWNGVPYEMVGQPINVDGAGHTWLLMCIQGVRDGGAA